MALAIRFDQRDGVVADYAEPARLGHITRDKVTASETKVVLAKKLHADKSLEIDDVCKTLRISRSTFHRNLGL